MLRTTGKDLYFLLIPHNVLVCLCENIYIKINVFWPFFCCSCSVFTDMFLIDRKTRFESVFFEAEALDVHSCVIFFLSLAHFGRFSGNLFWQLISFGRFRRNVLPGNSTEIFSQKVVTIDYSKRV